MAEQSNAKVRPIRQWSPIWVVPLAAVLIGLWMLYNHHQQQGALLTLIANDAEGIIAGKTTIKNRSVDVGQVVSVELSDDLQQVIVKARMKPSVTPLLNTDSQFWVVKPQIGRGGITGLNTLLSGAYIELQPGDNTARQLQFRLLDTPPIAPADAPGIRITLTTNDSAGLAVGDPVLYRGYDVGSVEQSEFDLSQRRTHYQLYIREPFDVMVTENVRFWRSSGFAVNLSAEGLKVDVGSAATLLTGGVSFDLMQGWPAGKPVADGSEFQLFPDQQSIQDGMYSEFVEYLLFFDESVRGLKTGAPVEYRGVRVGTVASVPFFFAMDKPFEVSLQQGIPVLIRIEAGRLYENLSLAQLKQELEKAVTQGMRATLKTGNLLTGALYIDLDLTQDSTVDIAQQALQAQQLALSQSAGYPMLPTARSGLSNIEQKVLLALDKINNLPIEQLLLQGEQTMQSAEQTMQQLNSMVQQFNALLGSEQVQQLPADLQQSLTSLQQVLAGFSPGAPVYDRLNGNLQALDQVMRELQPVLQTLNQQSNALVFDAEQSADPQPKRAKQ